MKAYLAFIIIWASAFGGILIAFSNLSPSGIAISFAGILAAVCISLGIIGKHDLNDELFKTKSNSSAMPPLQLQSGFVVQGSYVPLQQSPPSSQSPPLPSPTDKYDELLRQCLKDAYNAYRDLAQYVNGHPIINFTSSAQLEQLSLSLFTYRVLEYHWVSKEDFEKLAPFLELGLRKELEKHIKP